MVKLHGVVRLMVILGVMTMLLGCAATQTRESTGGYVDDSVITAKVKAAIFDEATLKTLQITVVTFKGEVQLSGFVDTAQNARKAGDVAHSINGVRSVKNDLIVK
ncbi:MAG: BON domain-containing protein [Pseudomonadota bacterium]